MRTDGVVVSGWRWCPIKEAPEVWETGEEAGCHWCGEDTPENTPAGHPLLVRVSEVGGPTEGGGDG